MPIRKVFIDMDGVLVDFDGYVKEHNITPEEVKHKPGCYLAMKPMPQAIEAVHSLLENGYDVWIATKPPTGNSAAYAEKAQWILNNLPDLRRRIIITHDKGLLGCWWDILVDDRPHKANCELFQGHLIRVTKEMTWPKILGQIFQYLPIY